MGSSDTHKLPLVFTLNILYPKLPAHHVSRRPSAILNDGQAELAGGSGMYQSVQLIWQFRNINSTCTRL